MGWINKIFRKKYYVWNETNKTVDVMSDFEFSVFIYKLKNPNPKPKIELNTKIHNEEFLIIRFDENNNILITNNCNLIKDDIINIIKEVSKLKTID